MKTKKTWHGKQAECTESGGMERQRKLLESSAVVSKVFKYSSKTHIQNAYRILCLNTMVSGTFCQDGFTSVSFRQKAYMVGW